MKCLAQEHNAATRQGLEPELPDPESSALKPLGHRAFHKGERCLFQICNQIAEQKTDARYFRLKCIWQAIFGKTERRLLLVSDFIVLR